MGDAEGLRLRVRPAFELAVEGWNCWVCSSANCPGQSKNLDAHRPQVPRVSNKAGSSAAAQWLGHTGFSS